MSEGWFAEKRKIIVSLIAIAVTIYGILHSWDKSMKSEPASSELAVLMKLDQAKRLGADGRVGYDQSSYQQLSQSIGSHDLPYLMSILAGKNPPSIAFVALGSKCDIGLDHVISQMNGNEMSADKAKIILAVIQNFDGCAESTKIMAAKLEKSLSNPIETASR